MNPTLFHKPWWLNIVAPNKWEAAEIIEEGRVIASMPYVHRRRFGLSFIEMPPLTQVLGPIEPMYSGKYASRLARQKYIYEGLLARIPRYDLFRQSFHSGVTNWLPFYWQGFAQSTRYTYRLDLTKSYEQLWAEAQTSARGVIRMAERTLRLREEADPDLFLAVIAKTFQRQGMNLPYDASVVHRLFEYGPRNAHMRTLAAEDECGKVHGVALFIGDENCVYYLMGGADPSLRMSGCQSLLLWEGICWARTFSRIFDFEGSMIKGVESFARDFGAQQQQYFQLTAMSQRMSVLWHGAAMLRASIGRQTSIFSV